MSPRSAGVALECIGAVAAHFGLSIRTVLHVPIGHFQNLHDTTRAIGKCCREGRP